MSLARWRTYLIAGGFNEDTAHRLYLWNAAIGQSFHYPLQAVEVALRNVVHLALAQEFGSDWPRDSGCRGGLELGLLDELAKAERRHLSKYRATPSTAQIVASLSLGFWVSLLKRDYNGLLWNRQTAHAFPHLKAGETIVYVARTGRDIQNLRNRIFHQEPLIGHNLSGEYAAILRLLGWMCPETRAWVRRYSSVPRVIRLRP